MPSSQLPEKAGCPEKDNLERSYLSNKNLDSQRFLCTRKVGFFFAKIRSESLRPYGVVNPEGTGGRRAMWRNFMKQILDE